MLVYELYRCTAIAAIKFDLFFSSKLSCTCLRVREASLETRAQLLPFPSLSLSLSLSLNPSNDQTQKEEGRLR